MDLGQTLLLWSALPTPLTPERTVDVESVGRLIRATIESGVTGVFLGGTCGEGPWLTDGERARLVEAAAAAAQGRLKLAAQVSDNSVPRVRDNVRRMAAAGADIAIVASPATFLNATPDRVVEFFVEAAQTSELPVGIYDLGLLRPFSIPVERLAEVYRLPTVCLVKDSSGESARRDVALAVRRERPELMLFNGDEFRCLEYLEVGYPGMMFGGAIAIAPQMQRIAELMQAGRGDDAREADAAMRERLWGIYGGAAITCWLTGLKHYLVRRGLFVSSTSFLDFPLTAECRDYIETLVKSTE